MPRAAVPQYRRHANGQAFVYHRSIPTKDHRLYLGRYDTDESKQSYRQFLRRLEVEGKYSEALPPIRKVPSIGELILAYDDFASQHYLRGEEVSHEYNCMRYALAPMLELFGRDLAEDFGPKSLKLVQRSLIQKRLARTYINKMISRIKRFFRWICEEEFVPPEVYHRLLCVRGLQRGEQGVREAAEVTPACPASAQSLLPFVSPTIGAMIQVQYLCGMRPGEVCIMRDIDIDRTADIWWYKPQRHKNEWRGYSLVKAVPQAAQIVLSSFIDTEQGEYLFRPADSVEWAKENRPTHLSDERKTPIYPSELRQREKQKRLRKRRIKKKTPGQHYTTHSYRRALDYGFERASKAGFEIERFTPNQLRHAIVTYVSQELDQQDAQRWAGHKRLETTSIYVATQRRELKRIACQLDKIWE